MTTLNHLGTNALRRLVTELRAEGAAKDARIAALRLALYSVPLSMRHGAFATVISDAAEALAADDKAARESALDRMAADVQRLGLGYGADDKAAGEVTG